MSNLAKKAVTGTIQINSVGDLTLLAEVMAASGFFADAKSKAQCAVKILAGLELGLPAFASMTGISIIQGKPTLSANLKAAMVKRSGIYDYRVRKLDDTGCVIEFFQRGESVGFSSFGPEDAAKAGIKGVMYGKYPRNMFFARAMSNGVNWYCPDLFLGTTVYTPEELADMGDPSQVIDVPMNPIQEIRDADPASALRAQLKDWLAWTGITVSQAQELAKSVTGKSATTEMTEMELLNLRNALFIHGVAAKYDLDTEDVTDAFAEATSHCDPTDSRAVFDALEGYLSPSEGAEISLVG